jgi:tRNA threonylcarbamoyladenosine biosynthesis protein TsaE
MIESAAASLDVALPDPAATAGLAKALAARAAARDVIALWGDLGLGKTTFARAFIQNRPGGEAVAEVPSPTFNLVQVYELPEAPVWHFDLYRLTDPEDAWELGIEEAFSTAITLIEWPDRLGGLLPAERLDVALQAGDEPNARRARLRGHGGWAKRLEGLTFDA